MIRKAERKLIYPISLILSTAGKKTASNLSEIANLSINTMLRLVEHNCVTVEGIIQFVKNFFGDSKIYFIIDDSLIEKMYSKLIEGSSDNYDSSSGITYRSICSVVAMITDGKYAIPIDHRIWTSRDFLKEYKTKIELAQEIIGKIKTHWNNIIVLMDGLYASKNMINWLNQNSVKFEVRFHSNRVIKYKDKCMPVKDCLALVLKGKWKKKTIEVTWQGITLYITVIKREHKRRGYVITYQASNFNASAEMHMKLYGYRWNIEKFFRTAKQSLGLSHCQSRKKNIQHNHILNVFYAYAILQFERRKKRLSNSESALRRLKPKKYLSLITYLKASDQIFGGTYA